MKTPAEIEKLKTELKQIAVTLEGISKGDASTVKLDEVERLKNRAEELHKELKGIFTDLEAQCQ